MNSLKDIGKKTREFRPDRHQQITHNRHWQKETGKKGSGVIRKDTRFPQKDLAKDIGILPNRYSSNSVDKSKQTSIGFTKQTLAR